jgi:hypothetical protein
VRMRHQALLPIFVLALSACGATRVLPPTPEEALARVRGLHGWAEFDSRELSGAVVAVDLHDTSVRDADLGMLKGFPKLAKLDLGWTRIDGRGLENLEGLDSLRVLRLTGFNDHTYIHDADLAKLPPLPLLEFLVLDYTGVTDNGIEQLRRLPRLRSLRMQVTRIDDAGIALLSALPSLESLDISRTRTEKRTQLELAPVSTALQTRDLAGRRAGVTRRTNFGRSDREFGR